MTLGLLNHSLYFLLRVQPQGFLMTDRLLDLVHEFVLSQALWPVHLISVRLVLLYRQILQV
jgi:hypothetical protein